MRIFVTSVMLSLCYSCLVGAMTLTLMVHWSPANMGTLSMLQNFVAEYCKLNPNITINLIGTGGGYFGMLDKLKIMIAGGTPPDAVHTYVPEETYYSPLPPETVETMKKMYIPQALQLSMVMVKGKYMGYPTEFQSPAVIYNKEVMENVGVGKAPTPATWEGLFALAKKITIIGSDNVVKTYGFGSTDGRIQYDIRTIIASNGYDVVTPAGQAALNTNEVMKAIKMFKDMQDERIMKYGSGSSSFASGLSAMTIWEPWIFSTLKMANPNAYNANSFKIAEMPSGNRGEPYAYTYGWMWSIVKYSKNIAETIKLMDWLNMDLTDERTTRMGDIMAVLGALPRTYADLQNQPTSRLEYIKSYIGVLNKHHHIYMPSEPGAYMYDSILVTSINNIMSGKVAIMQELENAQLKLEDEMRKARM